MNFSIKCNCCTDNYSNNLREIFYTYYQSKVRIINDETNFLPSTFELLNFQVMNRGLIAVVLDYGNGITIGDPTLIFYDKNGLPVTATVNLILANNSSRTITVIDWKIFDEKYTTKAVREAILLKFGLAKYGLVRENKVVFNKFQIDKPFFKAIFFKNNFRSQPSLEALGKIIMNIHELDKKADENRKILNVMYMLQSNQKLKPEQLTNFGLTTSSDGRGILLTSIDTGIATPIITVQLVDKALSKWNAIENELKYWVTSFLDFSGITRESNKSSRENMGETEARISRSSAIETEYVKYRKQFFSEFCEYYKKELVVKLSDEEIEFSRKA